MKPHNYFKSVWLGLILRRSRNGRVPGLYQLAVDNTGKLHLVELDMSEEPELAINFGVRSAPTVVLLKQQQTLAQIAGLKPKKQYAEMIQSAL